MENDPSALSDPASIAQMRVGDLLDALAGKHISPGAGAAAAVTLALAAACAAKAAAISLKHRPQHAGLRQAQETLERIGRFALAGADRDAEAFTVFVTEHTLQAVSQLIREGDRIARLTDVLAATIGEIAPEIEPQMSGDLVAARALLEAARTVQQSNSAEAREEQAALQRRSGA